MGAMTGHTGGCHWGAVRYETDIDPWAPVPTQFDGKSR